MPKVITFIAPDEMVSEIEEAVKRLDTDQSKFVRLAVRSQLNQINAPRTTPAVPVIPPDIAEEIEFDQRPEVERQAALLRRKAVAA